MAHHLLRTFEVSNPRKSYAGPTVYRISCKVTQQGSQPEVVDELIVWRRFSEFKKLHKDLSKFYSKLNHNNLLPSLPRATYFDRFDERVIEERRQNILSFLHFVSEVPQLVEHECLDRFLGGGVYTPTSTSSSRTSSFSGSEGDSSEIHKNIRVSPPESVQESEQGRDSSEDIPHGGFLELGGVWLCKQPSLVDGLDSAGNDDPVPDQTPTFIQRSLSFEESNEDNVFTSNETEQDSSSSGEEDEEEEDEEEEDEERTSGWLQRAISLCSEGEDIETLASEAENSDYINDLSFPRPFSDAENDETSCSESDTSRDFTESQENNTSLNDSNSTESNITTTQSSDAVKSASSSQITTTCDQTTSQKYEPCRFLPQQPSFDCTVEDYLVAAASIVRDALSCELDGQYKESFHLYKKCVSLLLHGVQEEKDSKRRDAVRRKTAQYLLKAEALYTAYIHEDNKVPESTQTVSPISGEIDGNSEEDIPISTQLQLAEFSVIGIIGKAILVEKKTDKTTYVIKVFPKTEGHHSRHKHKRSKRRRHFLRAAYSKCPFLVELHQHCETDTAVFLLLEHARGGLVRDHLLPVLHHQDNSKSQSYVHNLRESERNKTQNTLNNQSTLDKLGDDIKEEKKLNLSTLDNNRVRPSSLESCVRVWVAEIVLAVAHLHKHGVICRDLNPKNVLLSDSGHVLLTHFSNWNDVNEEVDLFSLELNYCAPELFRIGGLTKDADWWSVGALFFEMIVGETLASHYPWGIRLHTQIQISGCVSAEAESLIKQLLVVTPSERLGHGVNGVDDIKTHPFFSGINWKTLHKSIHQRPT